MASRYFTLRDNGAGAATLCNESTYVVEVVRLRKPAPAAVDISLQSIADAFSRRLYCVSSLRPTSSSETVPLPTVFSAESGRTYQLGKLIGKGGFGEVYLATATPQQGLPAQVCIKITDRLSAWVREAYFAELLFREPRSLRVYDRFVEVDDGGARYCIAMEYAVHGDLSVWLDKKGAQSERFVRREIAAILQPLDILHRGQALHRDLTPFNVFVCEDEQLKLGDRHRGAPAQSAWRHG